MKACRNIGIFCIVLAITMTAGRGSAYTVYVDASNGGSEDGTSWATAWNTVQEGLADLAATNALEQGGHVVLITNGTYSTAQLDLGASHSGTSGTTNYIRAVEVGAVQCYEAGANWWCMKFGNVSHIVLDGIDFTSPQNQAILYQASGDNILVRNCAFRDDKIDIDGVGGPITYDHCLFYKLNGAIWNTDAVDDITIRNSIMVRCSPAAEERYPGGDIYLVNCCLWGNDAGVHMVDEGNTAIRHETQLNAVAGCSGNFIKNPGFASSGIKSDSFYTNSVCIGTATDGGNLGPVYSSWTIVDTPQNTYYVDPVSGSNSKTKEQAQTEAGAWKTLTKAAGEVCAGDTVIVLPGTETHTVWASDYQITLGRGGSYDRIADTNLPVTFRAQTPGTMNINCVKYGFYISGKIGGIVLDGFKIYSFYYAGVCVSDGFDVTVRNCTLPYSYNAVEGDGVSGGSVSYSGGGCTIEDSEIYGVADHGVENFGIIRRCAIHNCGLRGISGGLVNVDNCLVYSNGTQGIYLEDPTAIGDIAEGGVIENCVICNNSSQGIRTTGTYGMDYQIRNCIVINNNAQGIYEDTAPLTFQNCCLMNNGTANFRRSDSSTYDTEAEINGSPEGSGCIVRNPKFKGAGDFQIQERSPCINAGATLILDRETDYYGNPRLSGKTYDIGIDEYQLPLGSLFLVW